MNELKKRFERKMIVNPHLKKIVKESGRREITTSMIVEAEKAEQKVTMKRKAFLQNEYYKIVADENKTKRLL